MKKSIFVLSLAVLFLPLVSHANGYAGAYYAKVIQAPVYSCYYAVMEDNDYEYDIAYDSASDDIANGNYLYGEIEGGNQFAYNATTGEPLTLDYYDTSMTWNMVKSRYYSLCSNEN